MSAGPKSWAGVAVLATALAGCALPERPSRGTLYDFGPGPTAALAPAPAATPVALAAIDTAGALDGSAMLYRLGYADAQQLRPYAQARWSMRPAELVGQRLRERLGRYRPVLQTAEGAALARTGGRMPLVLRLDLEEFSHWFASPADSSGLVRVRATVLESTAGGERLLAQRTLVAQRPAASADASGGARALAAATDALAEELEQWLRGLGP